MPRGKCKLNNRHKAIFKFLVDFLSNNGYSPSIREIGNCIGVESTSLVAYYLRRLEDDGYIRREKNISRTIRIAGQMKWTKNRSVDLDRPAKPK